MGKNLAHAAENRRLSVAETRAEAKARLLADWWQAASDDPTRSVMIAYRRADVAELNTVARTLLNEQGRLGRERLRLDNGLELAVGDRILCTRNDHQLQIANGNRGTVVDVDRKQRAVVVDLDDSRRVTLPARYLVAGHVSYGYALTGHKTQGLTVERAFVLADDQRALKEWGYVALSRARDELILSRASKYGKQKYRPSPFLSLVAPFFSGTAPVYLTGFVTSQGLFLAKVCAAGSRTSTASSSSAKQRSTSNGGRRHTNSVRLNGGSTNSASSAAPATAAASASGPRRENGTSRASTRNSSGSKSDSD